MDSLKKLEEISLKNEALFNRVFGHTAPRVRTLQKNKQGNYYINGNFVYAFGTDGTENPQIESTWQQPDMNWILEPDVKFKASYIAIYNRKIEFQGVWESGIFKGEKFSGSKSYFEKNGIFQGGEYSAPNANFKAEEVNFISGKWVDYQNGILGTSNYKSELNNENDIAIISVPIGWTLKIKGDKKEINLKVLKKIDDKNTNFEFQTLNDLKKHVINWETIRSDYLKNGFVIVGRPFNLLNIEEYHINNITSVSLLSETPAVKAKNINILNFSRDKGLLRFFPEKIQLVLSGEEDIEKLNVFQRKIQDGSLLKSIKFIENLIVKGEIDGYIDDRFYYLKPIFNNNKGSISKINTISKDNRVMLIMSELNELLELLSFNSQIIKEATSVYDSLINNFKTALNIDKFIEPPQNQHLKQGLSARIIDFSKDKNLSKLFSYGGVPIKFQTTVKSEDIQKKVEDLQKIIDNGALYSSLIQIRHFVENGVIDGYSDEKWEYLKPVFNNIKGQKTIFDNKIIQTMSVINDMVWLLSFNSNIIKESQNKTFNWIVNVLKKIWKIDKFITNKNVVSGNQKTTDSVEPNEKEKVKNFVTSIKKAL